MGSLAQRIVDSFSRMKLRPTMFLYREVCTSEKDLLYLLEHATNVKKLVAKDQLKHQRTGMMDHAGCDVEAIRSWWCQS